MDPIADVCVRMLRFTRHRVCQGSCPIRCHRFPHAGRRSAAYTRCIRIDDGPVSIIEILRLTKCFDSLTAVDELSLRVEEGEIFGLLGPNGAGKATTLLMLTTLGRPTDGSATISGFDIVRQLGGSARRSASCSRIRVRTTS